MQRTVLMVHPEQRAKLSQLAARAHVSAAEINRRAIDAYNPDTADDNGLEQLAEAVIQSNKQTLAVLNEARQMVKESLSYFKSKKDR